jgi:hypothetical protein
MANAQDTTASSMAGRIAPTAFIDAIVDAAIPALDEEGNLDSRADLARALYQFFGGYTVADAVMMLGMIRTVTASSCMRGRDRDFGALCSIAVMLEEFAAQGNSSGPECASARALLIKKAGEEDDWDIGNSSQAAMRQMIHDVADLRKGDFGFGSRFDDGPNCNGLWWLYEVVKAHEGDEAARELMDESRAIEMGGAQ